MGLGNFTPSDPDDLGLEERVRHKIREHGFEVKKIREEGQSGNSWELDAVAYRKDGSPVAYFEVKDIGVDSSKATYRNQMQRAITQVADFRSEEVPGAVVVPHKRDFGNKDWGALLETLDCTFLEEAELDQFLANLE